MTGTVAAVDTALGAGVLLAAVIAGVGFLAWRVGPPQVRWSLGQAVGALALLAGVGAAGVVLVALLAGVQLDSTAVPVEVGLVGTVLGGLCATVVALRFAERRAVGLHLTVAGRHWGEAAAGLLAFLAISTSWALGLEAAGVEVEAQQVLSELLDAALPTRVLLIAYAVIGAPLFEELLFRGVLVPPLARRAGAPLAAVSSGLLFGVAHMSDPVAVVPLVVLGVGLAVLRLRCGSIVPGLVVHVINNLIALASFFLLSA